MKLLCRIFCFVAVLFVAFSCSDDDDGTVVEIPDDVLDEIVKNVRAKKDLPQCTKDKFGYIYYVTKLDSFYECSSVGWSSVDSAFVDSVRENRFGYSCGTCSDTSKISASALELGKMELVKVKNVNLSGFAQKGPFVEGTKVVVSGLDEKLNKTEKVFTGEVKDDKGAYGVSEISLNNQYALVEVQGFFRNEITGSVSSGIAIALHALVDLSQGKNVVANVNLLSELEQARAMVLVKKEGFNVPAAKRRATKEVFEMFGVDASKMDKSLNNVVATDISLADTTIAGAILYASTVMLMSDLSLNRFESRLAKIVDEFSQSGTWKDSLVRAEIADYINDVCTGEFYEDLRMKFNQMNLSKGIPQFEWVLGNFMGYEYGLDSCTSEIEKNTAENVNKQSDFYGAEFVCTDKRWHMISAIDEKFGYCTTDIEGKFKKNGKDEFYVCKNGDWKKIDECTYELKACTQKREDEYKSYNGEYFHCKNLQWEKIDVITYELEKCTEEREGDVERTELSGYFVCEDRQWNPATWEDYEIGKFCDESQKDSMAIMEGIGYYFCDGKNWFEISKDLYDVGLCTKERIGTCAKTESGVYYECFGEDLFDWYESDEIYCNLGECSEENEDENVNYDGNGYLCKDLEWKICEYDNVNSVEYGMACVLSEDEISDVVGFTWRNATEYEIRGRKVCNRNSLEESLKDWLFDEKHESAIYCIDECDIQDCGDITSQYSWVEASDVELLTRKRCKFENLFDKEAGYVCDLSSKGRFEWIPSK